MLGGTRFIGLHPGPTPHPSVAIPTTAHHSLSFLLTPPSPTALPQMLGGTRFIGVYLARMLIEAGHEVTLLTRGKKPVTYRIPDDTGGWLGGWVVPGISSFGAIVAPEQGCALILAGLLGWLYACLPAYLRHPCPPAANRSVAQMLPGPRSSAVPSFSCPHPPPPPLSIADESFERFSSQVKHIACDRTDAEALKTHLANKGFEGEWSCAVRCRVGRWGVGGILILVLDV